MDNIFVEFLPPWVETNMQPAFYDKESGTCLQQTARMYDRVNMLVRMFNKLSKQTKETVEEYIDKFNELHDYVMDYFENLDVQEEINNKLDEMAESGQLTDIIGIYLQTTALWTFDTVADMVASANLANGSFAKTLGYYSVGDGGGAIYKITDEGTADGGSVIAVGIYYAHLVTDGVIKTAQYGILGDGTTDETTKLQAFFNTTNKKYIVNSNNILIDGDIEIPSNSEIEFEANCKVTRKATSSNTYYMFNLVNKQNVTIKNAHIVGDRDTHTGVGGEWGYGINVAYSKNILIENAVIEKTWGDGIYIGTSFVTAKTVDIENIECRNCRVINCSRNGFSVCAGNNIRLIDCYSEAINRTAPKSGVDIEVEYPEDAPETLSNVYITGFSSTQCDLGIQVHNTQGDATNIIIDNHNSYNDNYGFVDYQKTATSNVVYRNANISKFVQAGIYIITVDKTNNCNILVQNITIDSCTQSGKDAVWLLGETGVTTGNITIDTVNVSNTLGLYEPSFIINTHWFNSEVHDFDNISIVNMNDEAQQASRRYFIKGGLYSNSYKFINCNIKRSVSGTYWLGNDFMNYITTAPNTTSTLVFNTPMVDGIYTFSYTGNTDEADHTIQFPAGVVVYNGNTQIHDGSGNKYYHITSYACNIVLKKENGVINIIDHNGLTL